jgi:protein gp37
MGKNTGISWCDHTFNPWWGCKRVSPACDHCYAAPWAARMGYEALWNSNERRLFSEDHWRDPLHWNKDAGTRGAIETVFCGSMCDLFEAGPDHISEERSKLWGLVEHTPWLMWLLLTKRARNIGSMLPVDWLGSPRANVMLGTTVEVQQYAHLRLSDLLFAPSRSYFVSVEPMLGPVDLTPWLVPNSRGRQLNWVICGGESGPGARPTKLDWVRALRTQCLEASVPFFFKQWGRWIPAQLATPGLPAAATLQEIGHEFYFKAPSADWEHGKIPEARMVDGKEWRQFPEAD